MTTIENVICSYERDFTQIFEKWVKHGLIIPSDEGPHLVLSCLGSWLVGNMIKEIRGLPACYAQEVQSG